MNESLINPFTLSHPTAVQTSLFAGAIFAKFDPTGRFIAAARLSGSVEIWDLETRAPIRWLDGHVKGVTNVDWSRNSRYLLTSSKDWNVLVWDLASACDPPQRHTSLRFDAPVVSATFHPKNSQIILALLATGEAFLCDMRKAHKARVELLETILGSADTEAEAVDEDGQVDGERERERERDRDGVQGSGSGSVRSPMTVARFDPTGKNIFVGTASGYLLVFNTRTKTMIARHKISGAGAMKGLDFTKSGRRLVTNSSDRTLRQFILPTYPAHPPWPLPSASASASASGDPQNLQSPTTPLPPLPPPFLDMELEPTHRFNDPINKTAWHAMCYSPDGEWLAGGAADPAGHKIYIWDISNDGQFASALDGGREPLVYLHWHPTRSSLASTTNQGSILIWHCPNPERWGAFAGGFEEVDENVEYEEREDEFDIEDEAVLFERKMKAEEEEVDIVTVVSGAEAAFLGGGGGGGGGSTTTTGHGTQSGNRGGAATPIGPQGNGNGHMMALDNDKLRPSEDGVGMGMGMSMSVDVDVDVESAWAEEDPDGDAQGGWTMRVLMDNEAAEYY